MNNKILTFTSMTKKQRLKNNGCSNTNGPINKCECSLYMVVRRVLSQRVSNYLSFQLENVYTGVQNHLFEYFLVLCPPLSVIPNCLVREGMGYLTN